MAEFKVYGKTSFSKGDLMVIADSTAATSGGNYAVYMPGYEELSVDTNDIVTGGYDPKCEYCATKFEAHEKNCENCGAVL